MQHLLKLSDLSVGEIGHLLDRAQLFRDGAPAPQFIGSIAANLFFEPSTRTQYSFNVAEEKLGMRVISFDPEISSIQKNESFYDTVKTFDSFGVDVLVIRHAENEYYNQLIGRLDENTSVLNGGDGTGNHPTQSLLDLLTIRQEFGGFQGLKCSIIGDIRHSRVAHTNFEVMRRLGMEVTTSGPPEYREENYGYEPFEEAIRTADIVMLLRIQHERHREESRLAAEEYHRDYGLDLRRVGGMKPRAVIMHPAPFNRNVEISDEVVECGRSRIFKQMQNGVYIRMAALERALAGQRNRR